MMATILEKGFKKRGRRANDQQPKHFFTFLSSLNNPSNAEHNNIKKFECKISTKKFKTDYNLWRHIKNTHERKLLEHKADSSPPYFHFNLNKLLSK
jgi:hypothetical protein